MSHERYITEYPNEHQAEMLNTWVVHDIGSTVYDKTVTFSNGAEITVRDGKGATELAEAIITRAKSAYSSAVDASKNSPDKITRYAARREVSRIEAWIRQSGIIALLSEPKTVLDVFRKAAKRNG